MATDTGSIKMNINSGPCPFSVNKDLRFTHSKIHYNMVKGRKSLEKGCLGLDGVLKQEAVCLFLRSTVGKAKAGC